MPRLPPDFDVYFSNTKIQNVLCPLCGSKSFRVTKRHNQEFDIDCRGRKVQQYNKEFAVFEWRNNFCPWTVRLSKSDFVRAGIAKADHQAKQAIADREYRRKKVNARAERERGGSEEAGEGEEETESRPSNL